MKFFIFIAVSLGLSFGNFVYQFLLSTPSWETALERSFFQVVAVAITLALVDQNA